MASTPGQAGLGQSQLIVVTLTIIAGAGLASLIRKFGLPSVVGELILGLLLGMFAHFKLAVWPQVINDRVIEFFAELGSILLLFEIGLESSLKELYQVGKHGVMVAFIGVLVPFCLGAWFIGDLLLGTLDFKLKLFIGATLAATSAGISVRVFKDLKIINTLEAKIVLSASIIDDVLGLIILAVVAGLVTSGSINYPNISLVFIKVIVFFAATFIIGSFLLPYLTKRLLAVNQEESMRFILLISICLFCSWLAVKAGLAAIVGAFIAGLLIDEKMLNSSHPPIELLKPLNYLFVPIFFVFAGMQVDIVAIASWQTLTLGLWISLVAIIGKLASATILPKHLNRFIVGFGMVPRGEVGLIFALLGRELGVFDQEIFASILMMVIVTSLVTPIILQRIVKWRLK